MSASPDAGWYPSPTIAGRREWWDGQRWTGVSSAAPGGRPWWFADPAGTGWRWWDGQHWTIYRAAGLRRPVLPIWVSLPVLVAAPFFLAGLFPVLADQLEVVFLAALPVLGLLGAFLWLNRVFPQPRESRWHAFLWGSLVAGTAAGYVNDAVAFEFGEFAAVVVSAPVGEEVLKGLGILLAIRRGEIANRLHGAIIAGWIAAGFTFAEEIVYLSGAVIEGDVAQTFFVRGILGSFAHPLFTIWMGLLIGAAVESGSSPVSAWVKGLVPAVTLHVIWNWTQLPFEIFVGFLVILGVTSAFLVRERRTFLEQHRATAAAIERAAGTVRLPAHRLDALRPFLGFESTRAARAGLPRSTRVQFDTAHASIARALAEVRRQRAVSRRELERMADYAEASTAALFRRI